MIPFSEVIKKAAAKHGLRPDLVAAVCFVESDFNPKAVRHEPQFQKTYIDSNPRYKDLPGADEAHMIPMRKLLASSLGIMQVMGVVAVEAGLPVKDIETLLDVAIGLEHGCRKLAKLTNKYGSLEAGCAAYNAGSPRRKADGTFVNQGYVTRVLSKAGEYRGTI